MKKKIKKENKEKNDARGRQWKRRCRIRTRI